MPCILTACCLMEFGYFRSRGSLQKRGFLIPIVAVIVAMMLTVPFAAGATGNPVNYVLTPFGYQASACVHGVPSGSLVLENGTVLTGDGSRISFQPCPYPRTISSPGPLNHNSNWVEEAYWLYTAKPITDFYGKWNVPHAPTSNDGQTTFLWTGLECCNAPNTGGQSLLQPVLQWGPAANGGGSYWIMDSWYVTASGAAFYSTPFISASWTDNLVGDINRGTCNVGCTAYRWSVSSENLVTLQSTTLQVTLSTTQTSVYANLETYNWLRCNDYPSSGSTNFYSLQLTDTQGTVSPSWSPTVWDTGCGEGVTIQSSSIVTLSY